MSEWGASSAHRFLGEALARLAAAGERSVSPFRRDLAVRVFFHGPEGGEQSP